MHYLEVIKMGAAQQIRPAVIVILTLALLLASPVPTILAQPGPSFQSLGDLPGGVFDSMGLGISANGLVAVGRGSSASGNEAFRWTQAGGMVGLGDLPGGEFWSQAFRASSNGAVIVGRSSSSLTPGWAEAFRWTSSGMVGLGGLPGQPLRRSEALGVSGDGSVVVGSVQTTSVQPLRAFRWTAAGGMVSLGTLPGGSGNSIAWDISGNGSIIVGESSSGMEPFNFGAFRWTSATGMTHLSGEPDNFRTLSAYGISTDGIAIVGNGQPTTPPFNREAFVWTEATGVIRLGDFPGGTFYSAAWDASSNGAVVVGEGTTADGREAFVWRPATGMRNLKSVLISYGLDLTGWTLNAAQGISDDGRTIVGWGIDPNGFGAAWLARLCADSDGDGVCDTDDFCPNTPPGEGINPQGCSCSQITPCDDGNFCNGMETCENGVCLSGTPPCDEAEYCDDVADGCFECLSDAHCDDKNPCTLDACVDGSCVYSPIAGCGGPPPPVDGNFDGIPDDQQDHVRSVLNTNGDWVTVAAPEGTILIHVSAGDNPSPDDAPAGINFAAGFISFTIEGIKPGATVVVQIFVHVPEGTTFNKYYKYGPTPDEPSPHWYDFQFDGTTGAVISGTVITLTFVDGLRGDADLIANGIIIDPGAPGISRRDAVPQPTSAQESVICGAGAVMPLGVLVAGFVVLHTGRRTRWSRSERGVVSNKSTTCGLLQKK